MRHGHAQHNDATERALSAGKTLMEAALIGGVIRDPALTPKGEEQAKGLIADTVLQKCLRAGDSSAEAVVVSPCRRTLQTAVIGLESAGLPFVAHDSCQECADVPSDTGRPVRELISEFSSVDFSQIDQPDDWFNKVGPWDFAKNEAKPEGLMALQKRCERFTTFIAGRSEECLIVVAHHTFLAFLLALEFANCEVIECGLRADGTWTVLSARCEKAAIF
eukprot:COSAG02_NODE_478_length_21511_cov_120.811087_18_plen_220_part_00